MDNNNKPLNVRLRENSQKNNKPSTIKKTSSRSASTSASNNSKDPKKKKNKKLGWKIFRVCLFVGIALCIIGAGVVLGVISGIVDDTESISLEDLELLPQATFLYDKDGNEITSLYDRENRIIVNYEDIPKNTVNAIVAIEDERFYHIMV